MATAITVTCPNVGNATFDLDDDMKTHRPLVSERHQFRAAIAGEGTTVMGDGPNFSTTHPVILIGDVVGTS